MTPTEILQHQSKTIAKLMLENRDLKNKYEMLREMSINSIITINEQIYNVRKQNELLKKVLAG